MHTSRHTTRRPKHPAKRLPLLQTQPLVQHRMRHIDDGLFDPLLQHQPLAKRQPRQGHQIRVLSAQRVDQFALDVEAGRAGDDGEEEFHGGVDGGDGYRVSGREGAGFVQRAEERVEVFDQPAGADGGGCEAGGAVEGQGEGGEEGDDGEAEREGGERCDGGGGGRVGVVCGCFGEEVGEASDERVFARGLGVGGGGRGRDGSDGGGERRGAEDGEHKGDLREGLLFGEQHDGEVGGDGGPEFGGLGAFDTDAAGCDEVE